MRVARKRLEQVAQRLQGMLGRENCVVVGGLALAVHGFVRATDDVDLLANIPLAEVRRRLDEHGIATRLLKGDVRAGDFPCVKGALDGIDFDVLPPLVPLAWEHALDVPLLKKASLRVVDLDGLIALKMRAGSPQDLMDVAMLVLGSPEAAERACELATAYRVGDRLDIWLADPRLKAKFESLRRKGTSSPRTRGVRARG